VDLARDRAVPDVDTVPQAEALLRAEERARPGIAANRFGTSDVSAALMRMAGGPKASVIGTARNWATAIKLLSLCD
jgi:hypothetical protein